MEKQVMWPNPEPEWEGSTKCLNTSRILGATNSWEPASVQATKGLGLQQLDKTLCPLLSSLWGVSRAEPQPSHPQPFSACCSYISTPGPGSNHRTSAFCFGLSEFRLHHGWVLAASQAEHQPRKMNIPPPPQSRPAVPAAPRAGPVRSQPRSLGSSVATLGEAERSAGGGEPPKARLRRGPPAAHPAGSAGPTSSLAQGHRSPRRVRAPPPRTRSRLGRARTLPGPPLRPWSPETAGRVGAGSEQGDPSHGRGRVRGQWRRWALIGDICPRARPLCGPELPAPPRQPLVAGPDVMRAANSGRAAGGRVIRLVAGPRRGAAGAREGGKPPVKPNFWSKGRAAPLRFHTPLAASPLRSTSAPWGKGGGAEGLSSGHGVSPGDQAAGTHCDTGCAQHFHTALSLPQHSLLLRSPPPPAPADPSPPHPTAGLAGPTILGSALCSSLKDPESGLVGPRPASTSPPTPHNAADDPRPPPAAVAAAAAARSGCRTIKQGSQRPPQRTPARRPSPRGPPLAAPSGCARPVAGRGAGRAGAGRGAEAAGATAAAAFSRPRAATSGGMGGR
ncbi:translation initiation factor IF-2-like [Bubalus kerabau]|uniref:translation initiation factor IF-2-like n=1 Tax=Bubalus carabanensis TaxID=3119969 RepID=UPI00244EE582|nr:translation initiation factor IF-2-like [Bubalus carabanensis]